MLSYSLFPASTAAVPAGSAKTTPWQSRRSLVLSLSALHKASGTAGVGVGQASAGDETELLKQDTKDVERDVFDVNGVVVKGSDGYEAVVHTVVNAILECDAALEIEDARRMAIQVRRGFGWFPAICADCV